MTELSAQLNLTVVASNHTIVNGVASDVFSTLRNATSDLVLDLMNTLSLGAEAFTLYDVQAEYMHPYDGYIIIKGALPPPPPPPVLLPYNGSAQTATEVQATVEAVTTAVTTVVVTAVAGAVAGSVAGAVAGAVGSSVGGAVGSAAGGAAAGGGAGGAGGGAGGGGALPLVMGAQRFSLSGGLAAEQSELDAGVSGAKRHHRRRDSVASLL